MGNTMEEILSVAEYCKREKISRSLLNKEWQQGRGPKSFKRGTRRFITVKAADDYRRKLEREARP
jgi:hypothetical protein